MWWYTETVNGELKKTVPIRYISIDRLIHLWETMDFTKDELFTEPEFNRYSYSKWKENEGLINLYLEWEEE